MEKTIVQIASEYLKAKTATEEAKARQEELGNTLKSMMDTTGEIIRVGDAEIKIQNRETYVFDDAVLPYLKKNGLETYVKEAVDEAGLKKAIKKSEILRGQLAVYITIKTNQSLVTTKVKE